MVEVYHGNTVYLDGQYTYEHLRRVMATMERIMVAHAALGREAAPEGFKTMDETVAPEEGWQTTRKGTGTD